MVRDNSYDAAIMNFSKAVQVLNKKDKERIKCSIKAWLRRPQKA
jgi:hypothetical protein